MNEVIKLADLLSLPKRWTQNPIAVSYWEERPVNGNRALAATSEAHLADDAAELKGNPPLAYDNTGEAWRLQPMNPFGVDF